MSLGAELRARCRAHGPARLAGERMQHLGQVGAHALALAGGEDDDVHGHSPWQSVDFTRACQTKTPARTSASSSAEPAVSARQQRRAHQELIHRARALAAFADRPDHQRLAATHVAGGEYLGDAGRVAAVPSVVALALPRASLATPKASSIEATGLVKPMARKTRSALTSNSLPGTSVILPPCHSRRTHLSAFSLPRFLLCR